MDLKKKLKLKLPADLSFVEKYLEAGIMFEEEAPILFYAFFYHAALSVLKKKEEASWNNEMEEYLEELLSVLETKKEKLEKGISVSENVKNKADFIFEQAKKKENCEDPSVAKEFLSSVLFYEVLSSFDYFDEDISKKIKYAKYKALCIIKENKKKKLEKESEKEIDTRPTDFKAKEVEGYILAEEFCLEALNAIRYKDAETAVKCLEKANDKLKELIRDESSFKLENKTPQRI